MYCKILKNIENFENNLKNIEKILKNIEKILTLNIDIDQY
jgi:exonuclease VII small subunit